MSCVVCRPVVEDHYCEFCPAVDSTIPEPIIGRDPGDENDYKPSVVTHRSYTASYRTISRSQFVTRTLLLSDSYHDAIEQACNYRPGEGWVLCGLTELT